MEDIPYGRFDTNLGDIMQNVRQIDRFLDVVFEFFYRRTDFYRIMKHENDSMGLPPGVARKHVMQAYMKYERIAQGIETPSSTPKEKKQVEASQAKAPPPAVESVVEVTTTEVSDLPGNIVAATPSAQAADSGTTTATDSVVATPGSRSSCPGSSTTRLNPDTGEVIKATACSAREGGGKKSVADSHNLNAADTYNGALRESYAWSQTLRDLDIKVFVPKTVTKAKQLLVEIRNDFVKIAIKGSSADGQGEKALFEGRLKDKVRGEETIWSLDPGNCVQLNLEKRKETWWKAVIEGEPEIDQKSIDNTQYVHEMDDESQADYQRVMYDMEQKRRGLPTSKEEETHNVLRQAWNTEGSPFQGTEFDPSKINLSGS